MVGKNSKNSDPKTSDPNEEKQNKDTSFILIDTKELNNKNTNNNESCESCTELNSNIKKLINRINQQKEKIKAMGVELSTSQNEQNDLKKSLAGIEPLLNDRNNLAFNYNKLYETSSWNRRKIFTLEQCNAKLLEERDNLSKNIQKITVEYKKLRSSKEMAKKTRSLESDKNEAFKRRLAEVTLREEKKSNEIRNLKRVVLNHSVVNGELKGKLKASDRKNEENVIKIEELNKAFSRKKKKLRSAIKKLEKKMAEIKTPKKCLEILTERLSSLNKEGGISFIPSQFSHSGEIQRRVEKITKHKENLSLLHGELDILYSDCKDLECRCPDFNKICDELNTINNTEQKKKLLDPFKEKSKLLKKEWQNLEAKKGECEKKYCNEIKKMGEVSDTEMVGVLEEMKNVKEKLEEKKKQLFECEKVMGEKDVIFKAQISDLMKRLSFMEKKH